MPGRAMITVSVSRIPKNCYCGIDWRRTGALPQLILEQITTSIQWLGSSKRQWGSGSNLVILIYILTYWQFLNFKMADCRSQWHKPHYLVCLLYNPLLHLYRSILAISGTIWSYLHQYLLSSITTLGAGELRHLTGMNMLYFTSHTFCSNGGRFGHLIKQVLSPIDMWLALIRWTSPILDF